MPPTRPPATPLVAAGALFLDGNSRVLLVHPVYKDTWDIPGGYVERGESPAAACRRELAEELDLDRTPLALLSVDWAPSDDEGDKLLFVFDCGPMGGDVERIRLQADELDRWAWVALDDLDSYVVPRLARRLRATASDGARYLEHGEDLPAS